MRGFSVFPALKQNQGDHMRRAAADGDMKRLARLLSGRAPADPRKKEHTSALQMACRHGHLEAAKALVAKGADVNRIAPDGTALMEAAAFGHAAIVAFLLENKADAQLGVDGDLPMHRAARSGHTAILRMLEQLPGGAEALSAANAEGKTPLMMAAAMAEGGSEAAAMLIKRGADPAAADKAGNTALHMAAISGNAPVARMLLATLHGGALAAAANAQGRTPMHVAALFGNEGVARALVERAPDMAAADKDGCTALHMLCKSLMMSAPVQAEIAAAMMAAGADPAACDTAGCSCSHYASGEALRSALGCGGASTSAGGAGAGAGAQQAVRAPALVAAAGKPSASKKEQKITEALQEGLAASSGAPGDAALEPAGTEAFLIKEALRKHTSEEPEGWKLGSEVAPH